MLYFRPPSLLPIAHWWYGIGPAFEVLFAGDHEEVEGFSQYRSSDLAHHHPVASIGQLLVVVLHLGVVCQLVVRPRLEAEDIGWMGDLGLQGEGEEKEESSREEFYGFIGMKVSRPHLKR